MNETKWVKLHYKFLKWEWYKDANTCRLFIHCLLSANWKESRYEGNVIPRGSFVTGRKKLAEELGLTEQEIRTALKHLISTSELTIKKTNKFSIISVKNYERYQEVNQQTNQQLTNNQPTTNQQLTSNQPGYFEKSNQQNEEKNSVLIGDCEEHEENANQQLTSKKTEYQPENFENLTTSEDNRHIDISLLVSRINNKYAREVFPHEYEKLENWLNEYGGELVLFAIDISVANNVKHLNYVHGILRNWKSSGFKTKQDVLEHEKEISKAKEEKKSVELFDYNWLDDEEG